MPSVLIIILNWNGLKDTIRCVSSLLELTYTNYQIVIVDNGSKRPIRETDLSFVNNKVRIIFNDKNRGFAGGVNSGIEYAQLHKYDYVALINNDATVEKNWLSELIQASQTHNSAITAGLLLDDSKESIDSAGEYYSTWGISFPYARGARSKELPQSQSVFGATGGAVLYKTSLFHDIGDFDETFFAYYEDADISFRAQLAGHTAFYTNTAIAYHKGGATSKKIPGFTTYQTFKNLPLLFWKNVPTLLLPAIGARFLILYTLIFANAVRKRSGWAALKGVGASIYYFWVSALWKRFHIQRTKKVSARYIWSILYHDLPPEQTGMRKFRSIFTGSK